MRYFAIFTLYYIMYGKMLYILYNAISPLYNISLERCYVLFGLMMQYMTYNKMFFFLYTHEQHLVSIFALTYKNGFTENLLFRLTPQIN